MNKKENKDQQLMLTDLKLNWIKVTETEIKTQWTKTKYGLMIFFNSTEFLTQKGETKTEYKSKLKLNGLMMKLNKLILNWTKHTTKTEWNEITMMMKLDETKMKLNELDYIELKLNELKTDKPENYKLN